MDEKNQIDDDKLKRKRELTNARVAKYRKKKQLELQLLNSSMQADPSEEERYWQIQEQIAERKRAMAKERARRYREKKRLNALKSVHDSQIPGPLHANTSIVCRYQKNTIHTSQIAGTSTNINNIEAQSTSNLESASGYYETDGNKEQDDDWSGKCQFLWKKETQDLNTTTFTAPANKIIKEEPNPLECVQQEDEDARRRTEVVYESSESEAFGKLVAAKHEKLTPTQRMYAESIIINTLNKALLQKLTENTALSEMPFEEKNC